MTINNLRHSRASFILRHSVFDETMQACNTQASAAWMIVVVIIGNGKKLITVVKDADFGQAITHMLLWLFVL
jgi:hypothetical protein